MSLFKQSLFIAYGYFILLEKTVVYIINRIIHACVLGNTRFISRVKRNISLVRCAHSRDITFNTRNKSGISAHPCIILYLFNDY